MSLVILLFGAISMGRLTNRELPAIDPPIVSVTTVFPGAAPEVVETSVTDILEDQVNGIEGVKIVSSLSREQVSQITVEFELGRDLEAAANDVRDRVARARNQLPEEIDEPVVAKRDADAQAVIWIALSGDGYDQVQLTTIAGWRRSPPRSPTWARRSSARTSTSRRDGSNRRTRSSPFAASASCAPLPTSRT